MNVKKNNLIKYIALAIAVLLFVSSFVIIAQLLLKQEYFSQTHQETSVEQNQTANIDDLVYDRNAPVYVTIYSHNEDSWSSKVSSKIKYIQYRNGLLERINLLAGYGIHWDWQSDQPVVQAMVDYESDPTLTAQTDGKNILVYMQDLGVSLDPHAHTNNYADITYLIGKLGAEASGVIGGLAFSQCGNEHLGFLDLISWHDAIGLTSDGYIYGHDYPQAMWKPEILSDPGMGGHWFDDYSSGVWRPGDGENFYTDQGNGNITYVGEGYPHDTLLIGETHTSGSQIHYSDAEYIKELVEKIKNGELPTGKTDGTRFMYTASIHMRDTNIVNYGDNDSVVTIEGLENMINELLPLQAKGDIQFVTFSEAVEIWENKYNSVPWSIDLTTFDAYKAIESQAKRYCDDQKR